MNFIINGNRYKVLLEEGNTIEEIARICGKSAQSVAHCINKYNKHIHDYDTNSMYRRLFDKHIEMNGEDCDVGVITRIYNALKRSNIYTIDDIINNKDRIINHYMRGIGDSSKNLIIAAFFTQNSATMNHNKIAENISVISDLSGISIIDINKHISGEELLNPIKLTKVNMALKYAIDSDNVNSKYHNVYPYVKLALQYHEKEDTLEKFLLGLSLVGTNNKYSIIKYAITSIG